MLGEVLAEVTRGGVVESVHAGHMVLLNADGSILFQKGDPTLNIYSRSSLKSIQASAMVRAGLDIEPRLLALVCASHAGTAMHQTATKSILAKAGLDEHSLQCILDRPLDEELRRTSEPTRLAMNCSGKHAGMLATCVKNGWPIDSYLDPEHPLQRAIKSEVEQMSGESVAGVSVDGCGAPLFLFSLLGLARAIRPAHLMNDGDTIFGLSVAQGDLTLEARDPAFIDPQGRPAFLNAILAAGAQVFSRACTEAVLTATSTKTLPCYRELCPTAFRDMP